MKKPTSTNAARWIRGSIWVASALGALACQAAGGTSTGGETHFLTLCVDEDGANACGGQFDCVCNVCTLSCDAENACGGLAGAVCVEASGQGDRCGGAAVGYCEVQCTADADCSRVSVAHRCEEGVCRAYEGDVVVPSTSNDQPDADVGDAADSGVGCAASGVAPEELLFIGDSFFALTEEIPLFLEDLARSAGVLSTDQHYRDGSSLLGNTLAAAGNGIADQYASAAAEAAVKVVIMNGGGADTLLDDCDGELTTCPLLTNAAMAAEALLAQMAEDGVTDVVYAFYPDPLRADVLPKIDALRPMVQAVCEASPVPCHWLDLREIFDGHYDEYILEDMLNPTTEGSRATADGIWALMQERCIAQ